MDSAELRRLARDRRQRTPELHGPNDFYGHAAMIKRYAGLGNAKPLHAMIEHGLTAVPTAWDYDVRAPFPTFLCAGDERAAAYRRARPDRTAIPIGPMIHYAADDPPVRRPRGRLLAFPAHSTHYMRASYDVSAFARTLAGYRDRFSDVAVCFYWKDILLGADAPYRAEGFECVTAGHMFDPEFLPRLRRLIEAADTVVSNRFGSYVPYAVALGRPAWLIPQRVTPIGRAAALSRDSVPPEVDEAATSAIVRVFGDEAEDVTPAQLECLEPLAGFRHVRSPEAIRETLAEASERYRGTTSRARRAADYLRGRVARPVAQFIPRPVMERIWQATTR